MSILIRIDAVYVNSSQRLFADEIIFVQTNQRKACSNGHRKAVRAAAINRNAIIKYGILVVPGADSLGSRYHQLS